LAFAEATPFHRRGRTVVVHFLQPYQMVPWTNQRRARVGPARSARRISLSSFVGCRWLLGVTHKSEQRESPLCH